MKKIGRTSMITVIVCLAVSLVATAALANHEEDHWTAPGVPDQQHYSDSGYTNHEQLGIRLRHIEQNSQGRVKVEVAGYSNRGREIYKATVGTGDKVVLIQSEIHGNEKTGTEAILNILQYLGSSHTYMAQLIRDEVTVVALPKMNPDGAELSRRGNDMTWEEVVAQFPQLASAQPAWNYYTSTIQGHDYASRPGFDVNRDFNPDLHYIPRPEDFPGRSSQPGWFITPEAQTVRDVYLSLLETHGQVDVFVDLHHQWSHYYVEGEDKHTPLSISAQFVADPRSEEGAKYAQYADNYNYDFSRQLNVAVYNALQEKGNSPYKNVTLYPQGLDLPGTALGSFALNGSGTILFEVRGQTQSFGNKQRGHLVNIVETGLYAILEGLATGEVYELDPEAYENIPLREYRQ